MVHVISKGSNEMDIQLSPHFHILKDIVDSDNVDGIKALHNSLRQIFNSLIQMCCTYGALKCLSYLVDLVNGKEQLQVKYSFQNSTRELKQIVSQLDLMECALKAKLSKMKIRKC